MHKQQQASFQVSESGLTIIECLIAVLVVSILMTAIAPVIALSVATRVQAKRVERATQAARSYIDGVSAGTIAAPMHKASSATTALSSIDAPTSSGSLACTTSTSGYPYCQNTTTSSLYCFDLDGGGCTTGSFQDLIVQAFRTNKGDSNSYGLGLRVYRADAFSDSTTLTKGTQQTSYTSGAGDRKAPLVEMTSEIAKGQPSFTTICSRVGGCS